MKGLKLAFVLLFISIISFAQETGTLKGRIIDHENLPMAGADVSVLKTETYETTDNNGFYSIKKLNTGSYELEVSYFGFATQIVPFEIKAGEVTVLDIQMEKGVNLNTINVTGSLTGTAKALNQQRNMVNVGNIISAEQVEQFPDDNMGDALKRVPGVNVQYDQGEARFGNIRGTAPDLSSVTMNGNRLPSAEGETRAFQLDLIPADLVQAIEVNKVVTPDMDGDAIGASVNLVTRSVPDKRRVRVDLSGGYNTIAEKANYKGAVLYADRVANGKLGFTLTGSVFNNFIGSENMEAEWAEDGGQNDEMHVSDFQVRKYDLQRLRQNYTASLDYTLNENHRIEIGGGYNQRDDYENRYRLRFKDIEWDENEGSYIAEIRRQTKGGTEKDARLERQKLINFNVNGEHDFTFMKMDWGFLMAKANEKRPHERYISLRKKDALVTQNLSDLENAEILASNSDDLDIRNYGLKELTEEYQWTEEKDNTLFMNLEFPLMKGEYENSIKIGGKLRMKDKERDNDLYEYEPINEDLFLNTAYNNITNHTDSGFEATNVPLGYFINEGFLGGLNLSDTDVYEKSDVDYEVLAENYTASEDVSAGYLRFDQKIGKKWYFIGGFRVEQTKVKYNGFVYDPGQEADPANGIPEIPESFTATGEQSKNYTNLMPSLLVKFSPAKLWNIKVGVTNTISRPKYFDLVPYQLIEREDGESAISVGNPNLEPTKSLNLDLMFEKYFKSIGLFEAGIFYKDISDFIVDERYSDYNFKGRTYETFKRPINGGDADLLGIELGFQRPLDFIAEALKNFSIYTNYTYTNSKIKNFNIEGRENEDLNMPGTPEHTINASLGYNTDKIEARLSYNYASDFIDEFSDNAFEDRYYDAVDYLDFNLNYNINKKFNAYLKVNNILNQPLRYFQGEQERTMQVEYYGIKYKLGVQINL